MMVTREPKLWRNNERRQHLYPGTTTPRSAMTTTAAAAASTTANARRSGRTKTGATCTSRMLKLTLSSSFVFSLAVLVLRPSPFGAVVDAAAAAVTSTEKQQRKKDDHPVYNIKMNPDGTIQRNEGIDALVGDLRQQIDRVMMASGGGSGQLQQQQQQAQQPSNNNNNMNQNRNSNNKIASAENGKSNNNNNNNNIPSAIKKATTQQEKANANAKKSDDLDEQLDHVARATRELEETLMRALSDNQNGKPSNGNDNKVVVSMDGEIAAGDATTNADAARSAVTDELTKKLMSLQEQVLQLQQQQQQQMAATTSKAEPTGEDEEGEEEEEDEYVGEWDEAEETADSERFEASALGRRGARRETSDNDVDEGEDEDTKKNNKKQRQSGGGPRKVNLDPSTSEALKNQWKQFSKDNNNKAVFTIQAGKNGENLPPELKEFLEQTRAAGHPTGPVELPPEVMKLLQQAAMQQQQQQIMGGGSGGGAGDTTTTAAEGASAKAQQGLPTTANNNNAKDANAAAASTSDGAGKDDDKTKDGGKDDNKDKVKSPPVAQISKEQLKVIELTSRNFAQQLGSTGRDTVWLIELYSPYCSHCTQFESTYAEIAKYFHVQQVPTPPSTKLVKVAKINGETERALSSRFGVWGYPSFYIVDGWTVYEFDGSRTKKGLIDYAAGGYAETDPIPMYSSPMGPMGLAQGTLLAAGMMLVAIFEWLQRSGGTETAAEGAAVATGSGGLGLSPIVAGLLMLATTFISGIVLIIMVAVFSSVAITD